MLAGSGARAILGPQELSGVLQPVPLHRKLHLRLFLFNNAFMALFGDHNDFGTPPLVLVP